jgi:hypothetical protein
MSGWWFQTWLGYFPFHIRDVILPIDELIFFKIVKTTNQTTINIQKPYPNRFSWTYMVRPGERAVRHLVAEMLGRGDGGAPGGYRLKIGAVVPAKMVIFHGFGDGIS